jgi:transcriptional regulator
MGIAKQNPQVKAMIEELVTKPNILELEDNVLVVFNGKYRKAPASGVFES